MNTPFRLRCMMHGFDLTEFDDWQGRLPDCHAKAELAEHRAMAAACDAGDTQRFLRLLEWIMNRRVEIERETALLPLAQRGAKFVGRGRGEGLVRKAIRRLLLKRPDLKNRDVWRELAARPPRGIVFCDNRLGRYIENETSGSTLMGVGRFDTICGQERRALKNI